MALEINTIANGRCPSQLSFDGLLISGLLVRVLPGSPTFSVTYDKIPLLMRLLV